MIDISNYRHTYVAKVFDEAELIRQRLIKPGEDTSNFVFIVTGILHYSFKLNEQFNRTIYFNNGSPIVRSDTLTIKKIYWVNMELDETNIGARVALKLFVPNSFVEWINTLNALQASGIPENNLVMLIDQTDEGDTN